MAEVWLRRKGIGNGSRILNALYTRNICAWTTAKPLQDTRLWEGDSWVVHGLGVVEQRASGFRYQELRKVVHVSDLEVGKEVAFYSQHRDGLSRWQISHLEPVLRLHGAREGASSLVSALKGHRACKQPCQGIRAEPSPHSVKQRHMYMQGSQV
jgi:hypothetical protein